MALILGDGTPDASMPLVLFVLDSFMRKLASNKMAAKAGDVINGQMFSIESNGYPLNINGASSVSLRLFDSLSLNVASTTGEQVDPTGGVIASDIGSAFTATVGKFSVVATVQFPDGSIISAPTVGGLEFEILGPFESTPSTSESLIWTQD